MEPDRLAPAVRALWRKAGKVAAMPMRGESMAPVLRDGDEVTVRYGTPPDGIFGRVVLFEREGSAVAHRIVGTRRRDGRLLLLEKGDNNPDAVWIDAREVLGEVIGRGNPPSPFESRGRAVIRGAWSRAALAGRAVVLALLVPLTGGRRTAADLRLLALVRRLADRLRGRL